MWYLWLNRDNILLGSDFDQDWYDRVLAVCGLREDVRRLPLRDQTWVQGNGDNLSGGQRQRISLARAIYQVMMIHKNKYLHLWAVQYAKS